MRAAAELESRNRLGVRARLSLVVEILSAYLTARRGVRRNDLPAVLERLRAPATSREPAAAGLSGQAALRLGRAVQRTLLLLPTDSRCLIQSLVLTRLLSRRGVPSRLVLGVSLAGGFEAHAWLECEGRALLPPGRDFERLVEL